MYLKEALGSAAMQMASNSLDIQILVDRLLFIFDTDRDLFRLVVLFIHGNPKPVRAEIVEFMLQNYILSRPNFDGSFEVGSHYYELIPRLISIYEQGEDVLKFLRGAIVELFTCKLVSRHCDTNECF